MSMAFTIQSVLVYTEISSMNIPYQQLYRLGLLFTPFFYLRWLGKETFVYQVNQTIKMKVRVNTYDKMAIYQVWKRKDYQDNRLYIRPDDIVIDVGAHIGAFSIWAANQKKAGIVYAYEPNTENFALLEENIKLNRLPNIKAFPVAVADKSGEALLYNSKSHNMTHSLFESVLTQSTKINTISLEEVLEVNSIEKVDYLKIDAEGAEYPIILSLPVGLLSRFKKIFIEFHDYLDHGHTYRELESFLTSNGFLVELERLAFKRDFLKMATLKAIRVR